MSHTSEPKDNFDIGTNKSAAGNTPIVKTESYGLALRLSQPLGCIPAQHHNLWRRRILLLQDTNPDIHGIGLDISQR